MHLSGVTATNLTADGRVTGSDLMTGLCGIVLTAGAAAATVVVYDGVDATGTKLMTVKSLANDTELSLNHAIGIESGDVFVDLTGADAEVTVLWK